MTIINNVNLPKQKHQETARTVVEQIGNFTLSRVGAKHLTILDGDGGLAFFVGHSSKRLKKVVVRYDGGRDLYDLEAWLSGRSSLLKDAPIQTFNGVYADQLSELVVVMARRMGVRV